MGHFYLEKNMIWLIGFGVYIPLITAVWPPPIHIFYGHKTNSVFNNNLSYELTINVFNYFLLYCA